MDPVYWIVAAALAVSTAALFAIKHLARVAVVPHKYH